MADETTQGAPPTPLDSVLDKSMSDAFDKIEQNESQPPEQEPAADTEKEASPPSDDSSSDGDHRDAQSDEASSPTTPDEKSDAEPDETEETEEPGDDDESSPLDPPPRWSAEDKAEFETLPREAQELMLKRERQRDAVLNDRLQDIAGRERTYGELDKVLSPLESHLRMNGLSPAGYVQRLVAAEQQMLRDPNEGLKQVARMFGANWPPDGVVDAGNDPGAGEYVDPQVASLKSELAELRQSIQADRTTQQQSLYQDAASEIEAFKAQPGHEHFDTVKDDIAGLIRAGLAPDLKTAYDKAVRMNPDIAKAEADKAERERQADERERSKRHAAKAAKARGTQPASKAPEAGQGGPKPTIDETMNATFERINAA